MRSCLPCASPFIMGSIRSRADFHVHMRARNINNNNNQINDDGYNIDNIDNNDGNNNNTYTHTHHTSSVRTQRLAASRGSYAALFPALPDATMNHVVLTCRFMIHAYVTARDDPSLALGFQLGLPDVDALLLSAALQHCVRCASQPVSHAEAVDDVALCALVRPSGWEAVQPLSSHGLWSASVGHSQGSVQRAVGDLRTRAKAASEADDDACDDGSSDEEEEQDDGEERAGRCLNRVLLEGSWPEVPLPHDAVARGGRLVPTHHQLNQPPMQGPVLGRPRHPASSPPTRLQWAAVPDHPEFACGRRQRG